GEGVGIAGIDDERARGAALAASAAPIDRRRGTFRAREYPGDRRAGREQRQQHVGTSGIADAGGGGREPHSVDRRQVGKLRGRERGDCGGHRDAYRRGGCDRLPEFRIVRRRKPGKTRIASSPATTMACADAVARRFQAQPIYWISNGREPAAQSFFGWAGGLSRRSILAPWRSWAMNSLCALRARKVSIWSFTWSNSGGCLARLSSTLMMCQPNCVLTG